ncbi:hypothetical protein GSI_12515 [Ganoderma sinense ZZ0214-1]|uniref:DNA repair metallo-beta-lactamase domain-containing protein n=1 Tax=Ganoderma sinense ZZ0214-1 TaxID=1077348 RepID=A0A2G8RSZ9_9APHY|nr:hypothetical protein GSI_12515 [Ganoderma sinense ZZ0214-1]
MSKKRKEPTTNQSSTILDFFGKGSTASDSRDAKKPKNGALARRKGMHHVKCELPEDIIVIEDSDDDDDAVEVSAILPAPRPLQNASKGNCESKCISVGSGKETRSATPVVEDFRPIVKDEPGSSQYTFGLPSALLVPSAPEEQSTGGKREPSPFGFPALLVTQEQQDVVNPPACETPIQLDCAHDGARDQVLQCKQNEEADLADNVLLGTGDWDMGDDELVRIEDDYDKVKAEEDDAVDIDLTLDDATSSAEEKPVESCPICEKELAGMSNLEIHDHVDACLNALPDSATPEINSASSASSSSKPLRPLSALQIPPVPSTSGSSKLSGKQGGGSGIFATLMTSHKENEAWKEASAVEDRDFRPTKANGGRRKAPFYKVMQGMPIAVDAFRYGAIPNVTAYFLTHAHSDHYTNLSAKWDTGPIYCSEGTANLIIHMLGVDPKWVHALPMDVATTIPNTGGVQVTLIEANHCPGSCLFLFEGKQTVNAGDSAYKSQFVGSAKVFRYLHCGDFRASPQHVLHPAIKGKHIDHCYLDTTYLDPKYCFPPQPLVISACAELAKRLALGRSGDDGAAGDAKPRTMTGWFARVEKNDKGKEKEKTNGSSDKILVVVGTYSIGKERIVKAIAKALDTKVYCDSRKAAILRCQSDPDLHALLTTDPHAAGVHLVPLALIATDRLKGYMERWKGHYGKAIGFRPTGWTFTPPSGTDMLPAIPTVISRAQSRTFTHVNLQPTRNSTAAVQVYGVPYSEHSSFFELTCFALSFDWARMIATVNVGSEASRGKMARWVERWEAERKKKGKVEVVGHRAQDYW